ncbi:MAG: hypothetical protein IKP46_02215 [Bacteroidales bacterium]|nr:hypothetical protein [Bacteroidales bacterium]
MEDNRKQILTSIEEEISFLKSKIASLEEKLLALSAELPAEDAGPIDLSEPVEAKAEAPVEVPVETPVEVPEEKPVEAPVEIKEEPAPAPKVEFSMKVGVAAPVEVAAEEIPSPAEPVDDLPEPAEPVEPKPKKTRAYRWMTDLPGVPVKNIRSAISLYDRALFINTLFKENYALYDKTISDLNAMATLDDAVDYIEASFPDWNLSSDAVYGFMMAIRKKLG